MSTSSTVSLVHSLRRIPRVVEQHEDGHIPAAVVVLALQGRQQAPDVVVREHGHGYLGLNRRLEVRHWRHPDLALEQEVPEQRLAVAVPGTAVAGAQLAVSFSMNDWRCSGWMSATSVGIPLLARYRANMPLP
jgi:hypothetical protein